MAALATVFILFRAIHFVILPYKVPQMRCLKSEILALYLIILIPTVLTKLI